MLVLFFVSLFCAVAWILLDMADVKLDEKGFFTFLLFLLLFGFALPLMLPVALIAHVIIK